LGLELDSLFRFGVGWSQRGSFSSWPLHDATGSIIGINRRFPDGTKKVIYGHRIGLYMPSDLPHVVESAKGCLVITEGATDAVAALDMGFTAVGRFSCDQGTNMLVKLVTRLKCEKVVLVGDADGPGRRGVEALAATLAAYARHTRVVFPPPPFKDLRAWHQAGAGQDDLAALIQQTPPRRLFVALRQAGGAS
jgi:hypothetical protein